MGNKPSAAAVEVVGRVGVLPVAVAVDDAVAVVPSVVAVGALWTTSGADRTCHIPARRASPPPPPPPQQEQPPPPPSTERQTKQSMSASSSNNNSAPPRNPNQRSAPSNAALLEAARLAFATGKGLHPADYWFTPGDREEPRLGFKGADIRSSRKRLIRNDEE